eukprot:CAMPEP_0117675632 /NCGR_PEP_ID=MMETSP0804-20121206/15715_1 /TAXON_ID=1074897 /ORGANISM="Tetraselmis astigmatica, Strain CCMP880" /LENGTH=119 /DNA_ID=CAMNT_0005484661 /DNA_START=246 /DNA_END=601 /DNA_ORIENTATION=-
MEQVREWWLAQDAITRRALCSASLDKMHFSAASWLRSPRGAALCKRHSRTAWRGLARITEDSFLVCPCERRRLQLAPDLVEAEEGGDTLLETLVEAGFLDQEAELRELREEDEEVHACV